MVALLTYPTCIEAAGLQKGTEKDSFSHRVWTLHGVIADPASDAGEVKNAKLSLLRALRKSRMLERATSRPSPEHRKGKQCGGIKVARDERIIGL
jgi:hypothetical protein